MDKSPPTQSPIRFATMAWFGSFVIAFAFMGFFMMQSREARDHATPDRARRENLPLPVRTVAVVESNAPKIIGATCVTAPSQQVAVRSGASRGLHLFAGTSLARPGIPVSAVHIKEGQRVTKGQLLFELESDDDKLVVEQWRATLAAGDEKVKLVEQTAEANAQAARLELDSANQALEFRNTDLDTKVKLLAAVTQLYDRQAATALEFFGAQTSKADAEYQKKEAELLVQRATDEIALGKVRDALAHVQAIAERESARFGMKLAERDVARCRIECPVDGFVGRVEVIPGQMVDSASTLTQVVKLDPLHVVMDFPQERTDEVAEGQVAEVVLDSHPQKTLQATVVAIAPQASVDTRTLNVTLELSNPDGRIKAGISGFARLAVESRAPVLPPTAVIEQGSKAMVFHVDGSRARMTEVKTGAIVGGGLLEVKQGLKVGDEVVLFGQDALRDNDQVNTDWRSWTGRKAAR